MKMHENVINLHVCHKHLLAIGTQADPPGYHQTLSSAT